jgi:Glyoxalase-like domain
MTATSFPIAFGIAVSLTVMVFSPQATQMSPVDLDHVILGINNLERGIKDFESGTGVTPKPGGEHPGRGTRNAIVTLGNGHYLEILAPAASMDPNMSHDVRVDPVRLTFVGWALRTRAMEDVAKRLRAAGFVLGAPVPGSRQTPDGALLQWQAAAVREPNLWPLPFFIEWSKDTVHPSVSAPGGCTLATMAFIHPSPERLQAFFNAVGFSATVAKGQNPAMRLTLDCVRGRIEFGS